LAAQTIVGVARQSPVDTLEVNVRGAWNVFEACREHGVSRVVFASSDKAYGSSPELPYREDFPLRAANAYDASKAAADIIARSYAHTYGLPLAVTRFANIYGGGDLNFSRLIPEATIAVLDGRPPVIRSDGSPERDFLYVDDAVAAYLAIERALDQGEARGEAFNAGGERPHSVREVVDLIAAAAGTGIEPEYLGSGTPDGEIDRQYVDSTKLRELTGWSPRVELADGLRRTLDWYRGHPEARPATVAT
jgi:CDP-glucose 4,6-dehydratase